MRLATGNNAHILEYKGIVDACDKFLATTGEHVRCSAPCSLQSLGVVEWLDQFSMVASMRGRRL